MGQSPPLPPLPSVPPAAVVRVTLSALELGDLGPLTLRVGQRILAEVLAVQSETGRTLLSLAGRRMEAQVPAGLRQGELVRLVVTEALPDRLVFRVEGADTATRGAASGAAATTGASGETASSSISVPIGVTASPSQGHPGIPLTMTAVLAELGLPDSAALRAGAVALVERRLPLSPESLSLIRNAITTLPGNPTINARAAVFLMQEGLPVTPRAVTIARTALPEAPGASTGGTLAQLLRAVGELVSGDGGGPVGAPATPASLLSETVRGAASRLAVMSPEAGELERAVGVLNRSPEALVAVSNTDGAALRAAGAVPGADELPHIPGSAQAATPSSEAGPLTGSRTPADAPAVGAGRVLLGAGGEVLADEAGASDGAPADSTRRPASDGLVAPSSDLDLGEPDARTLLRALADVLPEGEARQLADALHDRIELQQLRTAVRAAATQRQRSGSPDGDVGALRTGIETGAVAGGSEAGGAPAALRALATLAAPAAGDPAAARVNGPATPFVLSVPLAFGGQFRTLELIVERDPDGRRSSDGEPMTGIRTRFTLDLRRLGEVGGDIRLQGAVVRCRLTAADRAAAALLTRATDQLRARLERAGLEVRTLECVVAEPPAEAPPAGVLRHVAVEA